MLKDPGVGLFPYMVAVCQLYNTTFIHLCGGTLIKPQWVLTSQGCQPHNINDDRQVKDYFVAASIYNLQSSVGYPTRAIKAWIQHPEYGRNEYSVTNDISLLYLESSFVVNQNMAPIILPSEGLLEMGVRECELILWKTNYLKSMELWANNSRKHLELTKIEVSLLARNECRRVVDGKAILTYGQICASALSANVMPASHSGGPLVCGGIQFGHFSWQVPLKQGLYVPIFTRTDVFQQYISSVVPHLITATKDNIQDLDLFKYYRSIHNEKANFGAKLKQTSLILHISSFLFARH